MSDIINRVAEFLKEYNLQDKTVVVGFSGGYDSMCLLDILSKLCQRNSDFFDLKVVAAHFNHNWRGEESQKEQEICRMFAISRGFEFYTKIAPIDLKKTENDARIARYEFFEETLENFDADAVFTAHNKDDNAETVLYRVIKGTGIVGLKGISLNRGAFYRPLLKTKRSEIVEYCENFNLNPNIDSSNFNENYRRNYLRLNVIPSIEQINPMVKDALNNLAEVARNDNEIIEEYLSTIKNKVYKEEKINSQEYVFLSKPVKMRILHEYIQNLNLDYDLKKVKEIYDFVEDNILKKNGATMSLASALWLYVDNRTIETIPNLSKNSRELFKEIVIDSEGEYIFDERKLIIKPYSPEEIFVFPESTASFAYVNLLNVSMPLTLRTRRDGDLITPLGMNGSMKLKKYFNSKGVNRHKRDEILLLTSDNEVLWAVGVGLNNKIAVNKIPTHVIEVI